MSENVELLDTLKRVVLEAENLIERLEEDKDSNLRWIVEKDSLIESLNEAREFLWKGDSQSVDGSIFEDQSDDVEDGSFMTKFGYS